jgi:RecA/RadA recombinase
MVKLIVGQKGTGKTKRMIALANDRIEKSDGNVVFINKNHRLMYDLKYTIRVVCMEDYEEITNSDEYIGFIFGIISSDHDIEAIFIDSILKHADFSKEDIPEFLDRLAEISEKYEIEVIVSLSAQPEELGDAIRHFTVLNEKDLAAG